ncbi:hypothetical protein OG436_14365 [Streptomyces caniferus]|uniref:hypothetical protein n=1 Tax=Streptomyces caniferus TaxID=285557 RepID=UPI002E2C4663|nr:hypothetical protein [Streptomyces caniferus]
MSDTAEKAADMLNAVSGPREVAGVSVSDNGRRQIIDLFKRAGLTESQAITIVDHGVLPTSLASAKPTTAVAAQFRHMDPAVKAALATLKPKPGGSEARKNSNASGNAHVSVIPTPTPTPTPTQTARPDSGSDEGLGTRSFRMDDEGQTSESDLDEDASEALGDLVDALNPFQTWSRSSFRVFSMVVPSVSEETGEVKVTVTTETPRGVTITTEITQSPESDIPTVVTQATDSQTGEALTDPITAKAPSVDAVSAVAFGQLAQGLYEAQAEKKAQDDEPAPEVRREASAESAEPAPVPSSPAQEREEVSETGTPPDAPSVAFPEGSEAGDGLPSELLGDLPQHAAA